MENVRPILTRENNPSMINSQSLAQHNHNFERKDNYMVCIECGKKILAFDEYDDDTKKAVRSDGKIYTKKANQNRFFFPEEWMKFEDILKDRQKHTCKCLLNTGARIEEMQYVQVKDFIYNPKGRSRIILRHTKKKAKRFEYATGKVRDVPISKDFAKYLYGFIQKEKMKPDEDLKILSEPATLIGMKKAARKAGLVHPEDFSPHTLRKTLEVWLMALGVDGLAISAHIGHDIRTALSHYVSPDIFSWEDKKKIKLILSDLYERQDRL